MDANKFICDIMSFHSTWLDVANNFIISACIVGLVYVWRTTRKKV